MLRNLVKALCALIVVLPSLSFAQDARVLIDKSRIPAEADNIGKFVPPGWKIEEKVSGDLNGDGSPDYALKLVEDKPAKDKDDFATERSRALVVLLQNKDGKLMRAGIADKLLQCTHCGGAFYGVSESPAEVSIAKGAIDINQDHGGNNLTNTYYRFRYDPETTRFILIGFEYADADRNTAKTVSDSTNYLTGVRLVERDKGRGNVKTSTRIPKTKIYLEQVDYEKFGEDAEKRLHL